MTSQKAGRTGTPVVIIEARTRAGALLDRPLLDVGPAPALSLLLRRIRPLEVLAAATCVVVTTDQRTDDPVEDLARAEGVAVVRGPADDAAARLTMATVRHDPSEVVLLDDRGPLQDPHLVLAGLDLHRHSDADLTTNRLPRSYPGGLELDIVSPRALRIAAIEAAREPGPPTLGARLAADPSRFRLANLHAGHDAASERWSLDGPDDVARLRAILAMVPDPITASWNRVLSIVGRSHRARPGQLHLRAEAGPKPGTAPWVQSWTAIANGAEVGQVRTRTAAGRVERDVEVAEPWLEPARDALYRLLLEGPHPQIDTRSPGPATPTE
jgi:spore coat polysaccharide biosynthesis protein SpsF